MEKYDPNPLKQFKTRNPKTITATILFVESRNHPISRKRNRREESGERDREKGVVLEGKQRRRRGFIRKTKRKKGRYEERLLVFFFIFNY